MKKLHAQISAILLMTGCASMPGEVGERRPNETVMHKDGYEVIVVHAGSTMWEIIEGCGVYVDNPSVYPGWGWRKLRGETRVRVGGCATLVQRVGQTCRVYAPMHDERIWQHELEHCRGYEHKEMYERGTM